MGQKVNPIGFRLGVNKNWVSRWFKKKNYSQWLISDHHIRELIYHTQRFSGIAKVVIERAGSKCKIGIHTSRPGLIIGKKGAGIDKLRDQVKAMCSSKVFISIYEIKKPEANAQLVAESIAQQIEKRVSCRRSVKKAMLSAQRTGVQGVKISCSGRIGGAEMSRIEWYREGRVPLHTIRANIDYGFSTAITSYGLIGCKVWLFKGEILDDLL